MTKGAATFILAILTVLTAQAQYQHRITGTYEHVAGTNVAQLSAGYQYRKGSNAIEGALKQVLDVEPYSGLSVSYFRRIVELFYPDNRYRHFISLNMRFTTSYYPFGWSDVSLQNYGLHFTAQPCMQLVLARKYGIEFNYGITFDQQQQWFQSAGAGIFYTFRGHTRTGCGYSDLLQNKKKQPGKKDRKF